MSNHNSQEDHRISRDAMLVAFTGAGAVYTAGLIFGDNFARMGLIGGAIVTVIILGLVFKFSKAEH